MGIIILSAALMKLAVEHKAIVRDVLGNMVVYCLTFINLFDKANATN